MLVYISNEPITSNLTVTGDDEDEKVNDDNDDDELVLENDYDETNMTFSRPQNSIYHPKYGRYSNFCTRLGTYYKHSIEYTKPPSRSGLLGKSQSSLSIVYWYLIGYQKQVLDRVPKTSTQSGTKNKYSIGYQNKLKSLKVAPEA